MTLCDENDRLGYGRGRVVRIGRSLEANGIFGASKNVRFLKFLVSMTWREKNGLDTACRNRHSEGWRSPPDGQTYQGSATCRCRDHHHERCYRGWSKSDRSGTERERPAKNPWRREPGIAASGSFDEQFRSLVRMLFDFAHAVCQRVFRLPNGRA